MPIKSIDLVLSKALISFIVTKLKPLVFIDSSSGTSVISPYLSKTKQKSFLIDVNR